METGKTSQVVSNIMKTALLRNLLITSLAVSVVFPIYSVFVIIPQFSKQLTKNTEEDAVRTASFLKDIIIKKKAELTRGSLSNEIISEIGKVKADFRLEKLKIFSKQGGIIFSTTPKEIGEINKNDYFYNIVSKGNIYTKVVLKGTKTLEGRIIKADVVETYVPVLSNGSFIGAFEIYYDITERKKDLDNLLTPICLVLFSIALILMITVIFILFKASNNILLREQAELALQKAYNSLENRINERTADLKKSNEELLNEINERKQLEEDLRLSEERYRTTLESIEENYFEADLSGSFTFFNDHLTISLGRTREELMGMNNMDYMPLESAKKIFKVFARIYETGAPAKKTDYEVIRGDGTRRFHELSASLARDRNGTPIGFKGVSRDVTERKKMEAQLQQSQKMESVGNLAGGIAHDFNNILSSIIGFTELALDEVEKDTKIEDSLQEVYAAGKRAKDLVKQILAFARQSDEEIKPIEPGGVAKEVLKFIRSSIPTSTEIKQNIESDSLIMGNATQVHQVLMNLCTNAAHAMQDSGGTLELSLKDVAIGSGAAPQEMGIKPGNYIEIMVSDTGVGIPSDIIGSIFEPYFTTKGPGEGTGMGLSLVHGIVETYGGKITVDSELGRGTVFSIYLPITKSSEDYRPYEGEKLPSGTERILFVDDELPIAKMGSQILERLGYRVTARTSSVEALELFRSKPNHFDLVITDMTMPNMTGDLLAIELMRIRSDIPVLLCTGYSKKISDETASGIGIKAFVYKPVVKADLAKMVRKVLDEAKNSSSD